MAIHATRNRVDTVIGMRGSPRTLWLGMVIAVLVLITLVAVSIATMPQCVAPAFGRIPFMREHLQRWWTDRWADGMLRAHLACDAAGRDRALRRAETYFGAAQEVAILRGDIGWLYLGHLAALDPRCWAAAPVSYPSSPRAAPLPAW